MPLNGRCHWIKWRRNIFSRSSKRPEATSIKPLTPLVSTVKRCIVSSPRSKVHLIQRNDHLARISYGTPSRKGVPHEAYLVKREARNEIRKMPGTFLVSESSE